MMTSRYKDFSLILAIIFCGTLVGAFTYSRIAFYQVGVSPMGPAAMVATGAEGFKEEIFWMFMHPIVVLSLYIALLLNWKDNTRRPLLLISILVYCLALASMQLFYGRHLTTFVQGHISNLAAANWMARALEWNGLGWLRAALMYISEISLLIALMRGRPEAPAHPLTAAAVVAPQHA